MPRPDRATLADAPRPSQRARQKRATRERLLEAARETFILDGYAAATVDAIAERAQTSRPTFYLHFASKLDVLQELSHDVFESAAQLYPRLDEILVAADRDAFRSWIRDAVAWLEVHGRIFPVGHEAALMEPEYRVDLYAARREIAHRMPRYLARIGSELEGEMQLALFIVAIESVFRGWAVDEAWPLEPGIDVLVRIWFPALTG
jgi:AcrR family transcriptional regulator